MFRELVQLSIFDDFSFRYAIGNNIVYSNNLVVDLLANIEVK